MAAARVGQPGLSLGAREVLRWAQGKDEKLESEVKRQEKKGENGNKRKKKEGKKT